MRNRVGLRATVGTLVICLAGVASPAFADFIPAHPATVPHSGTDLSPFDLGSITIDTSSPNDSGGASMPGLDIAPGLQIGDALSFQNSNSILTTPNNITPADLPAAGSDIAPSNPGPATPTPAPGASLLAVLGLGLIARFRRLIP